MEQKTKRILWITGISLVVLGAAVGIVLYNRKRNSEDKEDEGGELGVDNPYIKPKVPSNSSSSSSSSNSVKPSSNSGSSTNSAPAANAPKKITPRFNGEKELSNPLSEIKGKMLYPKRAAMGGQGYTNIRSTASVNTEKAWYDPFDNLITTIRSGTPIGRVLSESTAILNNYPYRWLKVKLYKKFNSYEYAFVRADTITFAPYYK